MNNILCSYSLLEEGRKYTGNHRKYIIENARNVCYAPATKEKIRLREAFGYYGHGRRILAGKPDLEEVELIHLPQGAKMISNIPSNITISFDIKEDGTVSHTQEILDTDSGKIVSSLHNSKIGGFSWAFYGETMQDKTTYLQSFSGFDYVLQPNFSLNRGYVLESANAQTDLHGIILESVASVLNMKFSKSKNDF